MNLNWHMHPSIVSINENALIRLDIQNNIDRISIPKFNKYNQYQVCLCSFLLLSRPTILVARWRRLTQWQTGNWVIAAVTLVIISMRFIFLYVWCLTRFWLCDLCLTELYSRFSKLFSDFIQFLFPLFSLSLSRILFFARTSHFFDNPFNLLSKEVVLRFQYQYSPFVLLLVVRVVILELLFVHIHVPPSLHNFSLFLGHLKL